MRRYLFLAAIAVAPVIFFSVPFLPPHDCSCPTGDIGVGCESTVHVPALPQTGARWHETAALSVGHGPATVIMIAAEDEGDEGEAEGEKEGEEEGEGGWDRLWDAPKLG